MENTIKNKNFMVIAFEVAVIILGIAGITFATSKIINDRTHTVIKTGEYGIDYVGDKSVIATNLEPISDKTISINSTENIAKVNFKVRGIKNNNNDNLIYNIMLKNLKLDCSLLNKYTKWNLYKNGVLLESGTLSPNFDNTVLGETLRLTTEDIPLPNYKSDYDEYTFILWISEACESLTNCRIDQSSVLNSNLSFDIFVALTSGEKQTYTRVGSNDESCANKPVLYENMLPVSYETGKWIVADKNNPVGNDSWYNYNEKKWANSVVVTTNNYNVGDAIRDEDVIAYYVWIPRYRYRLWKASEDRPSYEAYEKGIDIIFENGINKSTDEIANNNYLTHPVFGDNLTGVWVSKYELSKNDNNYIAKPKVEIYTGDKLENYQNIIASLNDTYNLGSKANISMISNLAWGSTLYLSHSKYGICTANNCDRYKTNESYISGNNNEDSTTNNMYGVFDMAGAGSEYVLGKSELGTATNEIMVNNQSWENGRALLSSNDYFLRGGVGRGAYYFGDYRMGDPKYSTRSIITNKNG